MVYISVGTLVFNYVAFSCHLDVAQLQSKDAPIVSSEKNGHFKAIMPSFTLNDHVYMNLTAQSVTLVCPGEENRFDRKENNILKSECTSIVNKTVFHVGGKDYDVKSLSCFDNLVAYENEMNQTCYNGKGELFEIGFQVPFQQFYKLYKICYNVEFGFTYYAEHSIEGFPDYPLHQPILVRKFSVLNPRMAKKLITMGAFMYRNRQIERLSYALGPELTKKYLRGQQHVFTGMTLVPHADFLVISHQIATHIFANLQYIWTPREVLWRALESEIRLLARNVTLKIITGVLEQVNISNQTLFMGPRKSLPIHGYFWKFVADPKVNACILFLMENLIPDGNVRHKCNLSCKESGWLQTFKSEKKVPTNLFCCDFIEMRVTIPHFPYNKECTSVLKFH